MICIADVDVLRVGVVQVEHLDRTCVYPLENVFEVHWGLKIIICSPDGGKESIDHPGSGDGQFERYKEIYKGYEG